MKNAYKGKIRKKLIIAIWIILIITFAITFVASQLSMDVIRKKSEKQLITQALDSADYYVSGQAETISEKINSLKLNLEQTAAYIEYVYKNSDEFSPDPIIMTEDFPKDTVGNTLHWIPFFMEDMENPDVLNEAQLLASIKPELKSIMDKDNMVTSLYLATVTHVNVAYDGAVLLKQGAGAYNPEALGKAWYLKTLETGKTFVADTYKDEYGRGLMITIATPFRVDGKIRGVLGGDIVIETINKSVLDIDIGSGYALLFSKDMTPICAQNMSENTTSADLLGSQDNVNKLLSSRNGNVETKLDGKDVYIIYDTIESTDWRLAIVLSVDTIIAPARETSRVIVLMDIILILLMLAILGVMMFVANSYGNKLTKPITTLSEDVERLGEGNLEYKSNITTGDEIEQLSHSFENMSSSLRTYIDNLTTVTAEKERIGAELDVASHIQSSMLPCIFPAFPDRSELDIYATMTPAKEVGGDFYDFFWVDERHIAIVMADVSGKGVPAALFMVIGKTLIKDNTQPERDLGEVFSAVNNLLCESNSEGLFITAFEGVLDLVTGEFNYVNAGHEPPFIAKKNEPFGIHKVTAGFVLAGIEGMKYKAGSITLEPGDKIFQYTDGVTEATDASENLYGMERLENKLKEVYDKSPQDILKAVKDDIDLFVGDVPQFDDITMLCLEYKEKMK